MCSRFARALIGAAVMLSISAGAGASTSWSFDLQHDGATATGGSNSGNARSYTDSGVTLKSGAYSNTGTNNGGPTQDNNNNNRIETAYLQWGSGWQGLGVKNNDAGNGTDSQEGVSPEHSIDNNERVDSVLLSFSQKVQLDTVDIGWYDTDSDFFVLAYIGDATPENLPLAGKTYAELTSLGWALIGNYSNQGTGEVDLKSPGAGSYVNPNLSQIYSSFWLIGAGGFQAGVGVNSGDTYNGSPVALGGSKGKYDYIKLAGVGGTTEPPSGNKVPEPASLALAGIAFAGMLGMRRRKAS